MRYELGVRALSFWGFAESATSKGINMTKKARQEPVSDDLLESKIVEFIKKESPEVFSDGLIDFDKLKRCLGSSVQDRIERYGLTWTGKTDCFRQIQQPIKGKTLIPCREESVNFDTSKNLFIEGDNLQVLKLLQRVYHGKVKMIYIDPPYNTGSDSFVYPDRFKEKQDEYQKRAGVKDDEGNWIGDVPFHKNTKDNGHYHSNWISMMYPRLFLARQLLRDDGVIFVSIDDNEVHNLRLIMDEIFGEENYRNILVIRRGVKSVQAQFETIDRLNYGCEYLLAYTKSPDFKFEQFVIELEEARSGSWNNHWRGTDRAKMRYELFGIKPETGQWRWSRSRSLEAIDNYIKMLKEIGKNESSITDEDIDSWYLSKLNESNDDFDIDLLRLSKNEKPEHYIPPTETKLGSSLWVDLKPNGSNHAQKVFKKKVFNSPKSCDLIKRLIQFSCGSIKDVLILDFFSGSGTTAQSVMELNRDDGGNRKFICVQLAEALDSENKDQKAGSDFCDSIGKPRNIAEICKERIRRAIKNLEKESEGNLPDGGRSEPEALGFKAFKLGESRIRDWECGSAEELPKQIEASVNNIKTGTTDETLLFELMLSGEAVLTAEVEKKVIGKDSWYSVDEGSLAICVSRKMSQSLLDSVLKAKPRKAIFLDESFNGNDKIKKNATLQFRDAGIEVKFV